MSRVSEKLIVSYEYKRQEPATRRGLAPSVLIFQTSPSCNIFTKIPNFLISGIFEKCCPPPLLPNWDIFEFETFLKNVDPPPSYQIGTFLNFRDFL